MLTLFPDLSLMLSILNSVYSSRGADDINVLHYVGHVQPRDGHHSHLQQWKALNSIQPLQHGIFKATGQRKLLGEIAPKIELSSTHLVFDHS